MAKAKAQELNYTLILVALILVAGFIATVVYLVPPGEGKTISVTGTAQITVPPDRAVVYVQIITRSNDSADAAKDMNSNISDAVLAAILNTGLERSNLETQGFTVGPEYDYIQDKGQVLKGYMATNSMKVTVSNFDSVGKIVDAAVDSGALISYINYELSLSKQNEFKAGVLANASKDAKTKAEAIVSGLGKSLGDISSVTTSDYGYIPYPVYRAEASGGVDVKQVATNLPPSNIDVSATVQVTYKIA